MTPYTRALDRLTLAQRAEESAMDSYICGRITEADFLKIRARCTEAERAFEIIRGKGGSNG